MKTRFRRNSRREAIWGYIFLAPWIVGFLAFSLGPILANIYLGFTDYSAVGMPHWIGLTNFKEMFTSDRLYYKSLLHTLYYVALRVPVWLTVGLALAMMLNRTTIGMNFLRTIFYLPTVLPIVASSVIWLFFLNPQVGFFNPLFRDVFGIILPNWLNNLHWAMPAIVMLGLWQVGQTMMIFLAGLQDIPAQLFEAAEIDGANGIQKFFAITLPMMTPTIYFNTVIGIISASQIFGAAFILTRGGPINVTLVYVLYLYRRAFQTVNLGYASAMAVILFLIVLALTVLVVRSSNRWVSHERI